MLADLPRHITTDEIDFAIHQIGYQRNIAGQSIELRYDELRLVLSASRESLVQFGSVIPPAALDLNKFAKQLPVAAIEVVRNGRRWASMP